MDTYSVVVEGHCLDGFVSPDVRPRLARIVGVSEHAATKLLAGCETSVKTGIDARTAMRYVKALRAVGVACRLQSEQL